ncbi:hypothetical protein BDZ97DRAFT_1772009 [Flammula alnicola]|nr:hypothetical protein BDZ97DRAFT_1772009 [Flammula alnicola]
MYAHVLNQFLSYSSITPALYILSGLDTQFEVTELFAIGNVFPFTEQLTVMSCVTRVTYVRVRKAAHAQRKRFATAILKVIWKSCKCVSKWLQASRATKPPQS